MGFLTLPHLHALGQVDRPPCLLLHGNLILQTCTPVYCPHATLPPTHFPPFTQLLPATLCLHFLSQLPTCCTPFPLPCPFITTPPSQPYPLTMILPACLHLCLAVAFYPPTDPQPTNNLPYTTHFLLLCSYLPIFTTHACHLVPATCSFSMTHTHTGNFPCLLPLPCLYLLAYSYI